MQIFGECRLHQRGKSREVPALEITWLEQCLIPSLPSRLRPAGLVLNIVVAEVGHSIPTEIADLKGLNFLLEESRPFRLYQLDVLLNKRWGSLVPAEGISRCRLIYSHRGVLRVHDVCRCPLGLTSQALAPACSDLEYTPVPTAFQAPLPSLFPTPSSPL